MGMFNEVFKKCPVCGGRGYMQIHEIVLGFGGFDLDDPRTLGKLTIPQLYELHGAVDRPNQHFLCDDCQDYFTLAQANDKQIIEDRDELIRAMFGGAT